MEDVKESYEYETQKVTHNLLKSNVENLTKEAKRKRLYRTQLLDLILEERYEPEPTVTDKQEPTIETPEDKPLEDMNAYERVQHDMKIEN